MLELLVSLVVLVIVAGLLYWLVLQLPLPEPFATGLRVLVVLICIVALLSIVFGGVALPWSGHLRKL